MENQENLLFGFRIGYDLGKLQFLISENSLVENQRSKTLCDIHNLLCNVQNIDVRFCNYEQFVTDILEIFRYKNACVFSGILLGIAIVEIIGAQTQCNDVKKEFIRVAKSKLKLIPPDVLSYETIDNIVADTIAMPLTFEYSECIKLIDNVLSPKHVSTNLDPPALLFRIRNIVYKLQDYVAGNCKDLSRNASVASAKESIKKFEP